MTEHKVFTLDIDIRFRDIDGRGHVNNAVYFTYCEHGRIRFYNAELQQHKLSEINIILAHTRCDFINPVTLSDQIALQVRVKEIGTKSFTLIYHLVDRMDTSVVYARAESVLVCFDYKKNVSRLVPGELKAKLSEYLEA
jgi:acyl-CoA thioester hydrolase